MISLGQCCVYFFRVLFGVVAFHTALFFSSLSFSFAVLRTDSLVEGLSSSTHAKTLLRSDFCGEFSFSFFLSFSFLLVLSFGTAMPFVS